MTSIFSSPGILAFVSVVGLFSSCATASKPKMHAPKEDYAYRVKGTEQTGKISRQQQSELFLQTKSWAWPLKSLAVTSGFGNRHGDFHDGLDLKAAGGTPVYAVSEGKIIYAGDRISGYGRMIVIKHAGELSTIYAHNEKLLARKGDNVKRGELIAYSGSSGRASGPHLHFEVRVGVKAINPLYVLPKRGYEALPDRQLASNGSSGRAPMIASRTGVAPVAAPAPAAKVAARKTAVATTQKTSAPTRSPANIHARVVSSRLSQSAAVRPVARRYRVDSVTKKDVENRRIVRETVPVAAD